MPISAAQSKRSKARALLNNKIHPTSVIEPNKKNMVKNGRFSEVDGMASPKAEHFDYPRDTGIFAATMYKLRVKQKMKLLREKELNILKQRRDLHKK